MASFVSVRVSVCYGADFLRQTWHVVAVWFIEMDGLHCSLQNVHLVSILDAYFMLTTLNFIRPYTTCSMKKPVSMLLIVGSFDLYDWIKNMLHIGQKIIVIVAEVELCKM